MVRAKIIGTGKYVPLNLVTNEDMEKIFGNPVDPSLEAKLGIKQRFIMGDDESSVDLATNAGIVAIKDTGLKPEQIDLIIVATDTPEYISPAISSVVQGRLMAKNAGTFDMNASCAGFVSALDIASRAIMTGGYNNVLLIGVYNMTKLVDRIDANIFPIFADGAGAVVLTATEEESGFLASKLIVDGAQYDLLSIHARSKEYSLTKERTDRTVRLWPSLITQTLEKVNLHINDVDHFFFTQINKWVIEEVLNVLELPMEKTTCIMDKYGYTGSACIPMALDVAIRENKIKKGDTIVFVASGVGFNIACAVFKW